MLLWVGCIAGALDEKDYRMMLAAAGFEAISVEPTRVYKVDDARAFLTGKGVDVDALAPVVERPGHGRLRARQKAWPGPDAGDWSGRGRA